MGAMVSQIISLTIVYPTVYSDADQTTHQRSASLAFCEGNSPMTGEFPEQRACNAENASIWERHHIKYCICWCPKSMPFRLTHWGRVTHICVSKLTIIGSDNGLSPGRRQAIILTNAGILINGPLGTNFSEILSEIHTFSLKKIRLKMSSAKCCSFRLGLNVLIPWV